jgi:hypothetical protein
MKTNQKRNMTLSASILALGIAALFLMVWLSPAKDAAPLPFETPAPAVLGAMPASPDSSPPVAISEPKNTYGDPFAAKLASNSKSSPPQAPAPASIPAGIDPFKEKLKQQYQRNTSSPFGAPPQK